jgi:hypothetical protein
MVSAYYDDQSTHMPTIGYIPQHVLSAQLKVKAGLVDTADEIIEAFKREAPDEIPEYPPV